MIALEIENHHRGVAVAQRLLDRVVTSGLDDEVGRFGHSPS